MSRAALTLGLLAAIGCDAEDHGARRSVFGPDHLVVPADDPDAPQPSHESSTFAWTLDQDADDLDPDPQPFVAASKSYWMLVDAKELATGVTLPTTSVGAHVLLHPAHDGTRSASIVDPIALTVVDPSGVEHVEGEALAMVADWDALSSEGLPLPPGAAMFGLDPTLGAGAFVLRGAADADAYVVQVHEPGSDAELSVQTDRDAYVHGDLLRVRAQLSWGDAELLAGDLDARLTGPGGVGEAFELQPVGDGRFEGQLPLLSDAPAMGEPYQVEVCALAETSAGHSARRCAHTAFSYAVPTARIHEVTTATTGDGGAVAELALEVAAAGRYAVSATVMGTDEHGALQPALALQTAEYFGPGEGVITLDVDAAAMADAGLSAPWVLQDLRLVDQGRLGVLQRAAVEDAVVLRD